MKKLFFIATVIFGSLSFKAADAQVHFSVGVNIGLQPEWGPVGYDHADYYYMPDIGAYYSIPAHQYIYLENNVWVHRTYLPVRYRNYDLYHGYKVVVNDRDPWLRDNVYRTRYASYRGRRDQVIIRDSHDDHYRNHWKGEEAYRHDNGNHYGQEREHGHGHGHGHDHDDH
jgi:hypothetical protein